MPKLTVEQLLTVAQAAGVQHVEIASKPEEADADFNVDTYVSQIDAERSKYLEPAFKEKLEPEIAARITGSKTGKFRSDLAKEFGLKPADLADLDVPAMIAKAKELSTAKYSQDTEGLRKDMEKLTADQQDAIDKLKSDYEGKLTAANQKYIDRDVLEAIMNDIKDAPLPQGANRLTLAKQLKAQMEQDAYIHYNEADKKIELRKKDNHESPLQNGTQPVKVLDKAKDFFTDMGVWQTSTKTVNPQQGFNNRPTNDYKPDGSQPIQGNSKAAINAQLAKDLEAVELPPNTSR